ncbi:MAG TPA: M48 family metallopeptidase [Thermoanaerobaculia bacterium]|nr:M48 family metallopeptidase [Thermoanaerobaculia bacterium]
MNQSMTVVRRAIVLAMTAIMSVAVANAQTNIKSGFNLFSAEQDVEIGRQSAAEAERQLPILTDREVEAYVNGIGQRLAAQAGGPRFNYQFRVVNASDINAFALPGGYIYLNRGILDSARNEGEVAGVLAHEIAHVALRHGTHQASKAYGAQAGLSILGGLLGGRMGENTAGIVNAIGGFGLNALFLKFSREFETQADVRGSQILAASGYAPADMVGFFQTLARVDTSRKTTWLSHHPAPPDRIARIQSEAKLLAVADRPTQNVAELNRVQARMRSLGAAPTMAQIARGTAPPPAATSGGSARRPAIDRKVDPPVSSLRSFTSRSGVYRVSYPSNWRVYEGGTGATIAPEGGIVEVAGRTEIVVGAVINHYDPFGNVPSRSRFRSGQPEITLESATADLLAQVQQGGRHLRVVRGSRQEFRLSGGRALATSLRGVNPNTGIDERVNVVTRQLEDGHLIYLLFVTPERDARSYAGLLQTMVNSLQVDDTRPH